MEPGVGDKFGVRNDDMSYEWEYDKLSGEGQRAGPFNKFAKQVRHTGNFHLCSKLFTGAGVETRRPFLGRGLGHPLEVEEMWTWGVRMISFLLRNHYQISTAVNVSIKII